MKENVGKIDRGVRIALSLILFSSFFILEGDLRYIALVGLVPLLTGLISFCPLYKILGINSCRIK